LPDRHGLELVIDQVTRESPKAKGEVPQSLGLFGPIILDEVKRSGFIEKLRSLALSLVGILISNEKSIGQQNRISLDAPYCESVQEARKDKY
jgi:hypothetical protein